MSCSAELSTKKGFITSGSALSPPYSSAIILRLGVKPVQKDFQHNFVRITDAADSFVGLVEL